MSTAKPITIIGGGLAGLTLGIGLRLEKIPVTIYEVGRYPRHRVCGEFISGRGQESLARLGLLVPLKAAGAIPANSVVFFSPTKSAPPRPLPIGAICLSRFTLDALLANIFTELGGRLIEAERRLNEDFTEGVVRATGRRAQAKENGTRWFGLKVHVRNVPLAADLEMHVSPRGYVGLCKINGNEVNVCGLFRRCAGENPAPQNSSNWLRGRPGSPLNRRLDGAEFDEQSFCAVAGLSLQPRSAAAQKEVCVGDAITMIPPVTGNGMSMAFESAELAVAPLAAWSRGDISWGETQRKIAFACDTAFKRRLVWAKWLQRLMLTPALQNPLVGFTARIPWFWRLAFERTR